MGCVSGGRQPTVEEGDEFISGALRAECEGNGGEAVDCVESQQDIVVLYKVQKTHGQHMSDAIQGY